MLIPIPLATPVILTPASIEQVRDFDRLMSRHREIVALRELALLRAEALHFTDAPAMGVE